MMWPYTAEELDYLADFVPSPALANVTMADPLFPPKRGADDESAAHRHGERRPTIPGGA
jgi:hypothetical protein